MSPEAAATHPEPDFAEIPGDEAAAHFPEIVGFIDTVSRTRVSGWAWNKRDPDARLEVEVRLDGEAVATVSADRPRPDLARGGDMGDGAYGFQAQLPEIVPDHGCHRVSAVVHHKGRNGPIRLANRFAQEAERLEIRQADFQELMAQLDQCLEDQRSGFRWIYHGLHMVASQRSEPGHGLDPADQAEIARLAETQATLVERLEAIEVFHTRLDGVIASLKTAPAHTATGDGEARAIRRMVWALAALTALSLGLGIASYF